MEKYDLAIIGSGPAGHTAAFRAARYGLKTVLIEKNLKYTGGVCLNEGCIPLKGMLHYSKTGNDFKAIRDDVFKKVEIIKSGLMSRLQKAAVLVEGSARFVSSREIDVNGARVNADYFLIGAGASSKKIFSQPNVYTSEKIFSLEKLPGKILIIGGGVIGCEYASFFNNMGADVTIIEILDSIIYGEDEESVRTLMREFKKKGITVHTKKRIGKISDNNEVTIKNGDKETVEKYDMIFETTGRKPNIEDIEPDSAGIELTEKGFIKVNSMMQSVIPNIYAAGDCIDTPMLAYAASKEAEIAVDHITKNNPAPVDYSLFPRLVFSSPRVGGIGLNEKLAAERGIETKTYKYFFRAVGKAVVEGKEAGFLKLTADRNNREIIGASAVGDEIADILNELSVIITNKIKIDNILDCVHLHPSYSEIIIDTLNYGG